MAVTAKNRRGGGNVAIAAGNMNILTESETRKARKGWERGRERRFRKFQSAIERFASLKIGETYRSIPPLSLHSSIVVAFL